MHIYICDSDVSHAISLHAIPKDSGDSTTIDHKIPSLLSVHSFVVILLKDNRHYARQQLCLDFIISFSRQDVRLRK